MLSEELKEKYVPLKDEVFQLLLGAYSYDQKIRGLPERLKDSTRCFLLEEATAIRMMANEIILHLCKLDDDSSNFSFRSAIKDINKLPCNQKAKDNINELLKNYRSSINEIKVKHRNACIAHRNSGSHPELLDFPDYNLEFRALVKLAHQLINAAWGAEISFGFKLGSQERYLDFIAELDLRDW